MEDGSICGASCSFSDQISVDKLSDGLKGKLEVDVVAEITNSRNDMQSRDTEECEDPVEEEKEDDDDFVEEELLAQMGYAKSELHKDFDAEDEEEEGGDLSVELVSPQLPEHQPITTTLSSLNLVSALKGSRLKEGEPAEELHVSWAPDVYDPPTGYTERLEATESKRHRSEPQKRVGAGKNKQKSGGRGGGDKGSIGGAGASRKARDKKQVKKHGKNRSRFSDYDSD